MTLWQAALIITAWLAIGFVLALPLGAFSNMRSRLRDTPSPCERDEDRTAHRNPKLNRAVSPFGSVHHHHGSASK